MSRPGPRALTCVVLALVLLLAACTDDGNDPSPDATPTEADGGVEPGATPPDPEATSAIFEPTDDVLNVAISEPSTLDPLRIQDPGSVLVARQLYEGLTRWDPIEETVQPAAAESWRASNGGRTFTFKLRPGMTFHDGTPVTSKDFRYAFDRIALKENASDIAYTLELIEGFSSVNQFGDVRRLVGIETPSDNKLVITLSEPFYDFPAVLTHPALVPLSQGRVERIDDFLAAPVGNGPFKMAEVWSPGQPVILESFAGFYETPELDGIRFLPYPDAAASWLQFRDGDLDVAEVPAGQIEDAEASYGNQGFKPLLASYYYGFNVRPGALSNIQLRRAINHAIDRDEIASTIYRGTMTPARGIVPAGVPGFQENLCADLCRYDPDLSQRLVDKLKPKDRRVTLEYTRGEPHDEVARSIRRDLDDIGLRVRLKGFGFAEYLRRLRDGDQGLYRLGWIGEYPIADVFLAPLFASTSPDNHSGFTSSRVDSLLQEARAEPADGRRLQLYVEAEKAILRQVPIAPVGSFVTHWAAQPDIRDLVFDVTGGFDAVHVFLESEETPTAEG